MTITCPICNTHDAIDEEALAYHMYYWHLCRKPLHSHLPLVCWCSHVFKTAIDKNYYKKHFDENGGVLVHYYASLLGVDPN